MLLLISVKTVAGSPFFDESGIPPLIIILLLINIPTQFLTITMFFEVTKISKSGVWNDLFAGIIFNILQTIALAILINLRYSALNIYILSAIAVLYAIGVFAVFFTIYFLAIPIVKKINFIRTQYIPLYVLSVIILYFVIKYVPSIQYPHFQNGTILYGFLLLYFLIIVYLHF